MLIIEGVRQMKNEFVNSLQKIWKKIEKDYKKNRINSEHALQCVMYMQLRKWTDKERLTIFVEPSISPSGQESPFRPDFLIVKNDTVKYVIELKYWPQNYVPFETDWRKFYWWSLKQQKKVKVRTNKFEKEYEDYNVNVKYFLFGYIDNCFKNNKPNGAISTKGDVMDFIKGKEWRKSFSEEIYGEKGMKNLDWMKGKYIQAHGDVEKHFWEVFLVPKTIK